MSRSLHGLNFPTGPRKGVSELLLAYPGVGQRETVMKGSKSCQWTDMKKGV